MTPESLTPKTASLKIMKKPSPSELEILRRLYNVEMARQIK